MNRLLAAALIDAQSVEKARQKGLLPRGGSQKYSDQLNRRIDQVSRLDRAGIEIEDEQYPSRYNRTFISRLPGGSQAVSAIGSGIQRLSVRLQRPSGKAPFRGAKNRLRGAADIMRFRAERNAIDDAVGAALTGGSPAKPRPR